MRTPHPTPTDNPLPFEHFRGGVVDDLGAPATFAEIALSAPAVAAFDALLHELHADAARVDQPRLQQLAAWLLSLPEPQAHEEIEARLKRTDDLQALVDDPAWDADDAMRARIRKLLDYIGRENDLIPDGIPLLGKLDDALLIELAWPSIAAEVEEYHDFCVYRDREHPTGQPAEQRAAWLRDRQAELALLHHNAEVADTHFVDSKPESWLRVT